MINGFFFFGNNKIQVIINCMNVKSHLLDIHIILIYSLKLNYIT